MVLQVLRVKAADLFQDGVAGVQLTAPAFKDERCHHHCADVAWHVHLDEQAVLSSHQNTIF